MANQLNARLSAFLAAYAICGEVSSSAKSAGLDRHQVYDKAKTDPVFAARFEDAKAEFVDSLKAEALRRAREGTRKLIFHQGAPVYHTRLRIGEDGQPVRSESGVPVLDYQLDEQGHPIQAYESAFSDRLLLAMLAATDPSEYAPKNNVQELQLHLIQFLQLTGADGGPVKVEQSPTEVARRVAFLLHRGMLAAKQTPDPLGDPGGSLV